VRVTTAAGCFRSLLSKRWVNGLRHLAYSTHGWGLDAVGDLARLMRLPGTINAKQDVPPVAAELLTAAGPRYDPEELTEFIDGWSDAPSTALIALPPEPQAQPAFTLDADAEPPADKLAALLRNPQAQASWDHNREDFADQSPSPYDLSLASMAMAAEDHQWSDQAVVDLMIACRRRNHHPPKLRVDYFNRTLMKARLSGGDDHTDDAGSGGMLAEIEDRGLIPVLADAVEDEHFFAHDDGGVVYRFTGGRYVDAARWLPGEVREMLEAGEATKKWRANTPRELGSYLAAAAPKLWDSPPVNVINVQNGLLNVATGELLPHDAEHRSKVQLPITYDPQAECPNIDQFVLDTFPEDAVDVAYQMIALVMIPDMSVQKAVLLVGPGGNGKSIWLGLMQAFLGVENYSTVPLQRLEAERFSASRLDGMLANICADLPATDLKGSSVFKGITGGDRITAERKYHDSYDLQPYCKLLFSANTPPRTPDASEAFFDRWIVIPFERNFRGEVDEVPSRVLNARLRTPQELSGLLNRALVALQQLRANGISEPLSLLAAKERFRAATDPVSVWVDRTTLLVPGAYTPKAQLLEQYNADAINDGRPTISANAFGRCLRRNRPTLKDGQRRLGGRVVDVWLDLTVRSHLSGLSGESDESLIGSDPTGYTP